MDNNQVKPDKPLVLITGAAGLVGKAIIPLLEKSFALRLTDLNASLDTAWDYRQADLVDFGQTVELLKGVDSVVHLATAKRAVGNALVKPPPDRLSPYEELMLDVNMKAVAHVMETAKRAGVRKIVYLSSLTVYFGDRSRTKYSETDPVNPQNLYACTKVFGENLGRVYAREHGISVICLRIGQPFPSGTSHDTNWRTDVKTRSSCVALEDVARSVILALNSPVGFGIYNIVSASDNPRFDISAAKEIGYFPTAYFSEEGLYFSETGNFPHNDGRVVSQ